MTVGRMRTHTWMSKQAGTACDSKHAPQQAMRVLTCLQRCRAARLLEGQAVALCRDCRAQQHPREGPLQYATQNPILPKTNHEAPKPMPPPVHVWHIRHVQMPW